MKNHYGSSFFQLKISIFNSHNKNDELIENEQFIEGYRSVISAQNFARALVYVVPRRNHSFTLSL
jgi:hypothetical protein